MLRKLSKFGHSDPKSKWKDIQENYDSHHNKRVSRHVHRGDLSTTTRLLGYTDAMMATCATFLVVPIRHTAHGADDPDLTHEENIPSFMKSIEVELIMFAIGFLLIATIWESTNIRCIVIKRLDDFLVLLSILQMLVSTVLPFAFDLQGHFPGNTITVLVTTVALLLVEILEAIIIAYAFASPRLLHIEMKNWSNDQIRPIRNALLKKNLINIAFISTAALFKFYDYRISWVFFSLLILNPIGRKIYLHIKRHQEPPDTEHSHFYWFLMKGNISKERVDGFTDAATAIIACVMILDIIIEQFDATGTLTTENLGSDLLHLIPEFIAFLGAYIGVSLLWYVNHTVLHLFHTINTVLLYLQKLFLCCLSLLPLCANIMKDFTSKDDVPLAIRITSGVIFLASICNVLMVLWGYHIKEKVFQEWAVKTSKKHSHRQELYTKIKILNMPYWSIVAFIGTFGSVRVAKSVALACYICMCLSFIVLKLLFVNHIGKEERTKELRLTVKFKGGRHTVSGNNSVRGANGSNSIAITSENSNSPGKFRRMSDAFIAKHGESELNENEEIEERVRGVEYDGKELSSFSDNENEDIAVSNNNIPNGIIIENENIEDDAVSNGNYIDSSGAKQNPDVAIDSDVPVRFHCCDDETEKPFETLNCTKNRDKSDSDAKEVDQDTAKRNDNENEEISSDETENEETVNDYFPVDKTEELETSNCTKNEDESESNADDKEQNVLRETVDHADDENEKIDSNETGNGKTVNGDLHGRIEKEENDKLKKETEL